MRIGIAGAGLLGVGCAIELAMAGHDVDLFERHGVALSQASRQNEGKIHLGLVYGHDGTLDTARLMLRGAFSFAPTLRRWLDVGSLALDLSSPFCYLVHRDSLEPPGTLGAYYDRVMDLAREAAAQPGAAYVCGGAPAPCRRLTARERRALAGDDIADAFATGELAVDPAPLADALRARLRADPRISLHVHTEVTRITPERDGVTLQATGPGGSDTWRFDHVVNASWDDLLHLDESAGVAPRGPTSLRLKRYLRVRCRADGRIPSATIVLGRFGDVVHYGGGDLVLSWYPAGCTGLVRGTRHPDRDAPLSPAEAYRLRRDVHGALSTLVPALAHLSSSSMGESDIEGGMILALGTSDVDDPTSGLHVRTRIGPRSFGRYHTVDTGKWTLAPLFAREVASRILEAA